MRKTGRSACVLIEGIEIVGLYETCLDAIHAVMDRDSASHEALWKWTEDIDKVTWYQDHANGQRKYTVVRYEIYDGRKSSN